MRVAPILLFVQLAVGLFSPCAQGQESSVLAEGTWLKFAVAKDGLYRLTGQELASYGIDVSSLNIESVRMFGRGGGMLPQDLSEPRVNDLPEISIQVDDGGDGRLDDQDYLLFYGQSPHDLSFRADSSGAFSAVYQKNLYSDTTYYFLTWGGDSGKRIPEASLTSEPDWSTDYYQAAIAYEEEVENILNGSGREWYGETLQNGDQIEITYTGDGWRSEQPLRLHASLLGRSTSPAEAQFTLNGTSLGDLDLAPILSGTYTQKGRITQNTFTADAGSLSAASSLSIRVALSGSGAKANLDQLILEGTRSLSVPDSALRFRNTESVQYATTNFSLAAAQSPLVWDVTDPLQPVAMKVTAAGDRWQFKAQTGGKLTEFVAAAEAGWKTPEFVGPVENQDLKGAGVPNFLIITREDLVPEAERLAELRRTQNGLSVLVATNQQIYNEFSSGAQDITALRNYIKYLYDRQPGQLQAVLLLGKGSYDYKGYTSNNTNVVPIYQSRNSVHPIYSYSSDDYYGFLEDDEGEWEESFAGDHTLDIGIGRLPVKNREEARIIVDKLIHYESSESTLGPWRNEVVFVADDGDNDKHQRDAEQLAKFVDTSYIGFSVHKIYTDAFAQRKLPGGELAPQVNQEIEDVIKRGALIVNYTGHGDEIRWAHEKILDVGMINRFRNQDQLPFFVTATCEFGRHDDPRQISGAEQLILNPQGGGIGLVTTARPVFSNSNFLLNRAFYGEVFRRENGKPLSLGEIFRHTKNNGLNGPVNRNFSLLADPSMVLAYPQDQVAIDQLSVRQSNGAFVVTDTLRALDQVRISGSVRTAGTQQIAENFSGKVVVEVLDKVTLRRTQGNEGTFMQFEERNSVIHRGNARVSNGRFTLDFVIPKNIVYQTGLGKISAYAEADQRDAHGSSVTFVIGGSQQSVASDDLSPQIQLYMDDSTFRSGGFTGTNTLLLAQLQDEHGISISPNGLGQQITAELIYEDTQESRTFVLNDFYQTDLDGFQSGWVRYPLENLEEGSYRLTLRAWDTYNNEGTAHLTFRVGEEGELWVSEFYNYPNPFSETTHFVLDHNQAGSDLDIMIQIYNQQGELIHQMQATQAEVVSRLDGLYWDGRTTDGASLPSGIYHAVVHIRVPDLNIVEQKTHQLIIAH